MGSSEYPLAAYHDCSQMISGSYYRSLHSDIIPHCVVPRKRPRAELGTLGGGSVLEFPPPNGHLTSRSRQDARLRQQGLLGGGSSVEWH